MEEGPDGDAEAGADDSKKDVASDNAVVHVRRSNGSTITLNVALSSTVMSLKDSLVDRSNIPVDQQRLIYKGRMLVNERTLDSYGYLSKQVIALTDQRPTQGASVNLVERLPGLKSDHTVHLVRGVPTSTQATTSTSSSQENPAGQRPFRGVGFLRTTPEMGLGTPELQQDQAEGQGATNITELREWLSNLALHPWNATPEAGTRVHQAASAVPGAGGVLPYLDGRAGLGLPELEMMRDLVERLDPTMMQQLVHYARIQEMVQRYLSNPAYMNQIINMHPRLQALVIQNPGFREMMQNPVFIQQLTRPEIFQQLMVLQQALSLLRRMPGQNLSQARVGVGITSNWNVDAFINMRGVPATNPPSNPDPSPEELYAEQLSQLREMGFTNTGDNIQALHAAGGNVQGAIDRLLGNI